MMTKHRYSSAFRNKGSVFLRICSFLVILLIFLGIYDPLIGIIDSLRDRGDCKPLGRRRPKWDNRKEMIELLPTFAKIFQNRPIKSNWGGMRFEHLFALWYMLTHISPPPTSVVESGARRGQSTWLIRQALPYTKILSVSPDKPDFNISNTIYLNKKKFKDFSEINWDTYGIDPRNSFVLFDDHQAAFRRMVKEAMPKGFRRFIFDDNCEYYNCDFTSMKWHCETDRKAEWQGYYLDNFGKTRKPVTWEEHLAHMRELKRIIKYYYEFPPIRETKRNSSRALVPITEDLEDLLGPILRDCNEFLYYNFICYVEV